AADEDQGSPRHAVQKLVQFMLRMLVVEGREAARREQVDGIGGGGEDVGKLDDDEIGARYGGTDQIADDENVAELVDGFQDIRTPQPDGTPGPFPPVDDDA